jgi:hypothetical protein
MIDTHTHRQWASIGGREPRMGRLDTQTACYHSQFGLYSINIPEIPIIFEVFFSKRTNLPEVKNGKPAIAVSILYFLKSFCEGKTLKAFKGV